MALVPRFSNSNQNPIGMIVSSMLTEAQFQAINGTGWILADGRSVTGSAYATLTGNTTAPDLRGQVLRGKNNSRSDGQQDPAGEITLGTQQTDALQGHGHTGGSFGAAIGVGGTKYAGDSNGSGSTGGYSVTTLFDIGNGTPRTNNETRVKAVIVNHFIKINS